MLSSHHIANHPPAKRVVGETEMNADSSTNKIIEQEHELDRIEDNITGIEEAQRITSSLRMDNRNRITRIRNQ